MIGSAGSGEPPKITTKRILVLYLIEDGHGIRLFYARILSSHACPLRFSNLACLSLERVQNHRGVVVRPSRMYYEFAVTPSPTGLKWRERERASCP